MPTRAVPLYFCLDDTDLISHIKCIVIRLKANIRLLLTIRPDESVDFLGLNIIKAGYGFLDLLLVGTDVHDKHEGIVVLNLLHGRLSGERVLDDIKGIEFLQLRGTANIKILEHIRE